jgi:hypothetical protein
VLIATDTGDWAVVAVVADILWGEEPVNFGQLRLNNRITSNRRICCKLPDGSGYSMPRKSYVLINQGNYRRLPI